MGLTTILSLIGLSYRAIVVLVRLAKRVAPVLAVLAVLFAKLAAGDFAGLPELVTALIAAAVAVWNGEQVAKLKADVQGIRFQAAALNGDQVAKLKADFQRRHSV